MSETKLTVYSSVFTVFSLALCETILFHYLPKDEYGSYVYMRFNLLTIIGLFFACNFTFISAAFRNQPAPIRNGAFKKSLVYSFIICIVILLQVIGLEHQIQNNMASVNFIF